MNSPTKLPHMVKNLSYAVGNIREVNEKLKQDRDSIKFQVNKFDTRYEEILKFSSSHVNNMDPLKLLG